MGVDLMLAVVEPGRRSLETASRVREMAREIGIRRFGVVLNKSTSPDDRAWVERELGAGSLLGAIPWDGRIAQADRDGASLVDLRQPDLLPPFVALETALDALIAPHQSAPYDKEKTA
jgi:CO dehydrogenase maturation factor